MEIKEQISDMLRTLYNPVVDAKLKEIEETVLEKLHEQSQL
jgi:hypothetical protein